MSMNSPSLRGAVDLSALVNRPPAAAPTAREALAGDASGSPLIINATDANFAAVLELSRQVPVVVDLWATWCAPCTQLTPILEKLVLEYAGRLVLAKVDVDQNPQLAQAFGAQSIPTIAAVVGGQPVPMFTGALPEAQVRDVFEQLLAVAAQNGVSGVIPQGPGTEAASSEAEAPAAPPLPPRHQEAFDAIERGDYPAAQAAYKAALAENPKDADAQAGLAQVNLIARLHGKTLEAIRNLAAAEPANLDAQLDVVDLDISGGHIEDGFARLLELFATASPENKNRIRERLLELFDVVGSTDPRVSAARSKFASLLY